MKRLALILAALVALILPAAAQAYGTYASVDLVGYPLNCHDSFVDENYNAILGTIYVTGYEDCHNLTKVLNEKINIYLYYVHPDGSADLLMSSQACYTTSCGDASSEGAGIKLTAPQLVYEQYGDVNGLCNWYEADISVLAKRNVPGGYEAVSSQTTFICSPYLPNP